MGNFRDVLRIPKSVISKRKFVVLSLILLLIIILVAALAVGKSYVASNLAPMQAGQGAQITITIPKGASSSQIGQILTEAKLIRNPKFFAWYVRYRHVSQSLPSGKFMLSPTQNMDSIINTLRQGPPLIKVTIPEGYTTQQIVDLLAERKLIDKTKFYDLVKNYDFKYDFLKGIPSSDKRLEGFLFPATYDIPLGTSEQQIITMMLDRFQQELTPQIRQAVANKGWTIQQFVTMASLIEREAKVQSDRPIISQVFDKRLKVGMPLQSCASVEYLLGHPKPILSLTDISIDSPYNTYQHKGLPPGPIANPGHASLQAAAFPANTDYLYFVAKPDGSTAFAKTYSEHLRNVQKYEG